MALGSHKRMLLVMFACPTAGQELGVLAEPLERGERPWGPGGRAGREVSIR